MWKQALAGAALAMGAAPAGAATVTATFTGLVGGYDLSGLFVAPGFYEDEAFTATVVYDTDRGTRRTGPDGDEVSNVGPEGGESPIVAAELRIAGVTRPFEFLDTGTVAIEGGSSFRIESSGADYDSRPGLLDEEGLSFFIRDIPATAGLPTRLDEGFDLVLDGATETATGSFGFTLRSAETRERFELTNGSMRVTRLTVTVADGGPAPIPLPASGLLLLAALGGAGLAARRRV